MYADVVYIILSVNLGWKAVHIANEIFGFNGWSSSIQSQTIDYVKQYEIKYIYFCKD